MRAKSLRPRRPGLVYGLLAVVVLVTGAAPAWGQAAAPDIGAQQEAADTSTPSSIIPAPVTRKAPAAQAASFTLFNNTSYPNANLGGEFGLTNSSVVYDGWGLTCSGTGCSNVPSQSTFETTVQQFVSRYHASSTAPVTLDFESILPVSASSASQAAQEVILWKQLITWAHDAEPSAPIGMYSYDWSTTNLSYTQELYGAGYLDYFAPSMYTRWSSLSTWSNELSLAVSNDHSINPSLPIYPYLWPQPDDGSGNAYTDAADWQYQLQSVQAQTQGAILWSSSPPLSSTACGWLGVTSDEMGELLGAPSYGPLTVTAAVPNTCELTRGATTEVTVTFTNDGSSPSTQTTLQDVTGPQGITEAYATSNIPALQPGASWQTTLSVTVPSNETDTTALLHIQYGTGDQRLAVIIPSTPPSIIPAPVSMQMLTGPAFTVTANTQIVTRPNSDAALPVADDLAAILRPSTGFALPVISQGGQPVPGSIVLQLIADSALGQEGYILNVTNGLALMQANTPEGLFHGVQTLRQMLPPAVESPTAAPGPWTVPDVHIVDYPRYAYRGALLDVARHFFTVQDVEHYIDILSMYKINVLHLHLTDDQGWRIAINGLPQLTTIGGATQEGGGPGGFYTQQDYRDIVAYAAAHFMTVVPEIDMPGHVNAALTSIPDLNCDGVAPPPYTGPAVGFSSLCVDKPITYQFLTEVLNQIAGLTPGPYIHIGGDEALSTGQADYDTFENQVQPIVAATGKHVMGWQEIAAANLPPNSVIQLWHTTAAANALAVEGIAKGAKVLVGPSPITYLNRDTSVKGSYQWDPATLVNGVTEKDILGVEEDLWASEVSVTGYPKTTIDNISDAEFLTLPRGLDIAEIGWSPATGRTWEEYKFRLAAQEQRWQAAGLSYYRSPDVPWQTQLTLSNLKPLTAGRVADLTGTFTNNSDQPVSDLGVTLTAPAGWTVQPADAESFSTVAPNSSVNLSWRVSAPAGVSSGSATLSARATYKLDGVNGVVNAQAPVTVCSSMPPGDPTARGQWDFTIGCAADLSGNGHDGAAGAGVTFTNTGAAFNGTLAGQITVPYSPDYQPEAITPGQSWHLDLTGVVPSTISGQYQAIAIDRGPTANGWIVYETPTGGLQFWMFRAEDGKYPAANSGVTVVPGESYNIDVGWDGTRLSISVTGAATRAGSTALGGTYGPAGNVPMRFGAGGDSGTTAFFTGKVATAKITIN